MVPIIGVEGRLVDHGQHFPRRDIQHDDGSGLRSLIPDRRFQLPVREILDAQINRQHEILARPRGTDALDVLHDAAVAILDDPFRAVLSGQPMIERQLQALLPGVVDVGEAKHVSGDLAGGVVAAIFTRGVDPWNPERLDPLSLSRLPTPCDIEKVPVQIARHPTSQLLPIELQGARETRDLIRGERKLLGIHPYGIDRRAHRQRLTVSIGDRAAMRCYYRSARESRIAFLR